MHITSKGQVTIPQAVRNQLGLLPGTDVEFVVRDGNAMIVRRDQGERQLRIERALQRLEGSATVGLSTDDVMALTRDVEPYRTYSRDLERIMPER